MKRLISLLTLLLLWPAFASAASGPCDGVTGGFCITSGSFTYEHPNAEGVTTAFFSFSGNGFSADGGFCCAAAIANIGYDFAAGTAPPPLRFGSGTTGDAFIEIVLHGQELPIGDLGNPIGAASVEVSGGVGPVPGPGIYSGGVSAIFVQYNYETSCLTCAPLEFFGFGTAVEGVRASSFPGFLEVASAKFTFGVPEPATLSMFALGLVGLAIRRKAIGSVGAMAHRRFTP